MRVLEPDTSVRPLPLVTIVIPTYNRSEWLPRAIESVLQQTYTEFNLLISDNASTDRTPMVASAYDDARVCFVRRADHVGLNEHFNVCIDEVSSKYVLVLPDDDALLPDAIETLLPALEQNPSVGVAHAKARLEHGMHVVSPSHDMTGLDGDAIEGGATFVRRAMSSSHRIHATTALCRTVALKQTPLDMRDYPATEFAVWLRLALDWDVAFVARNVAVYQMHAGTYSASNAHVTAGGYIQNVDTIEKIYAVKMRFLDEYGGRLDDIGRLRREARNALRRQLVNYIGHATFPERRFGTTIRVIIDCVRREPKVVADAGAWRLLAGSVLGPRLVAYIKSRRRKRTPARPSQATGQ